MKLNLILSLIFLVQGYFFFSQTELEGSPNPYPNLIYESLQTNDFSKARKLISEGLEKLSKTDISSKATIIELSGELELKLGNYNLALDNFTQANKIWNGLNNQENYSKTLSEIGITHWKLGNNESAYDNLSKSANIYKQLNNEEKLADTYNNIGLIKSETEPEEALEYYKKALGTFENRSEYEEDKYLIIKNNIGIAYNNLGYYDKSIEIFEEDLEYLNKLSTDQSFNNEFKTFIEFQKAFTKANLAQTYGSINDYNFAKSYYKQSLSTYEKVFGDSHPEIASIHSNLSTIHLSEGNYDSALVEIDFATSANSKSNNAYYDRILQINVFHQKANIFISKYRNKTLRPKDLKNALNVLTACDTLVQEQRNYLFSKKDKILYSATAKNVYETTLECLLILSEEPFGKKRGYVDQTFQLIEKSKASTLLSSIQDAQAKKFGGIPASVLLEEKEIISGIVALEQELLAIKLHDVQKQKVRDDLSKHRADYRNFIKLLENKYPKYYELKYQQKSITPQDVQASLKPNELLVNYFLSERENKLIAFKITNKKVWIETRTVSPLLDKWMIQMKNSMKFSIPSALKSVSYEITKQVMLHHIPDKITKLTIIPDATLNSLPFEALISSKPSKEDKKFGEFSYLVQSQEINYHFATSLWIQNLTKENNNSFHSFAPVYFNKSHNFSDLLGTKKEAESLDSLFKVYNFTTKKYLDSNATENNLLLLPKGDILHVPTHGQVFSSTPEKSRILLSKTDSTEDGFLYLGEIYNSTFDYNLITLSACRTGLGKQSKGEGVIGLSRAFIYSGAKNIIVSYWKVDDLSTSELMVHFYSHHLKNSASFSKSLQEAKKKMILSEKYASPYYWAPFILIGE